MVLYLEAHNHVNAYGALRPPGQTIVNSDGACTHQVDTVVIDIQTNKFNDKAYPKK